MGIPAGRRLALASALLLTAVPGPLLAGGAAANTSGPSGTATDSQFAAAVSGLEELPGQAGLLVVSDGKTLAAHNDTTPLAVAGASRLAILAALRKAYAVGTLKPATVAALQEKDKAAAGGILQTWPTDTPVTVASAAALLAGLSDPTAADLLIRVLGREAVGNEAPPRDRPYLSPREMSVLKASGNTALADSWKAAPTPAAREHLLPEIDAKSAPTWKALGPEPHETGIEWFYTPRELCALMSRVADMPEMAINPVLPLRGWKRIAFAGGPEPGVIDMTYQLEANDGTRYCVSATWNDDKELGTYKFTALVVRLINALPH